MDKSVQNILEKGFGIRPEEQSRSLLMQIYIFLIIFTLLIVKPTASSLFLSNFGVESLPYAFILVAILAGIVSSVYAKLLNIIPLDRLIKMTLYSCIGSLLIFGVLLQAKIFTGVVLYAFYLWVMIFAVLTTSQFWVLANLVFNSREAKRLFGFIGAGAITGGIFGGYFASFITQFTVSENLLFIAALCLVPCLFLINKIWSYRIQKPIKKKDPTDNKIKVKPKKHPLQLILASKHLTYLTGIVGLSVIVAKLVDYQFSAIASIHYTNKEDLTAFFGFWFSTFNVISLGLQLFLTRRIMENVGVSRALYFMPVFILLAGTLMLLMPEVLMMAIFLKLTEGSLKQSVNKAAMELLVLPIPTKIKNPAKTFIDVFVDSFATGLSGLLLIFVIKGLALPPTAISLIILGITLVWLFLIFKIRKEYLYAFKLRIETAITPTDISQLKSERIIIPSNRLLKRLAKVLEVGTEQQILVTLKSVKDIKKSQLFNKTVQLFKHDSPEIRAAAIRNASTYKKEEVIEEVTALIDDDSIKVQTRALEYLLKHDDKNRLANIEEYLEDDHYRLRGVALVGLATASLKDAALSKEFHLENRLYDWFNKIDTTLSQKENQFRKIIFLNTIGKGKLENYYGHIVKFLKDENSKVVRQAIISAGITQKEVFLNILISFLKDQTYRSSAQEALSQFGEKAFPLFIEIINNPITDINVVRSLPKIIRKISSPQAVDLLSKLLKYNNLNVRHASLKALNRLRFSNRELSFDEKMVIPFILEEIQLYQETMSTVYLQKSILKKEMVDFSARVAARKQLISVLEKRLDINLERLFLLLGLKYSPEDMINIYRSIRGRKAEIRISALEFLDNLLGINLKKIIIPIIEITLLENLTQRAIEQLKLKIPTEYECLESLLSLHAPKVTNAVMELLKVSDENLQPLLKKRLAFERNDEKAMLNKRLVA